MDKRFFLALFLSLVVIAATQLLFPPAKPAPTPRNAKDSTARTASSTTQGVSSPTVPSARGGSVPIAAPGIVGRLDTSAPHTETIDVETPKAIYKFSSVGGAPTSVVIRDYKNRATNSLVDLGSPGTPLLSYRVLSPSDTVDLSRVPFTLTRHRASNGAEILSYSTTVGNHNV